MPGDRVPEENKAYITLAFWACIRDDFTAEDVEDEIKYLEDKWPEFDNRNLVREIWLRFNKYHGIKTL